MFLISACSCILPMLPSLTMTELSAIRFSPKQTAATPVFKPLHLCSVSIEGRVFNDCLSHPARLFLFQAFISLIV